MRQTTRALTIGVLSAATLAVISGSAQAQTNFFATIFGAKDEQPQINYSERPPLVLPKSRDLTSPGETATFDSGAGDWPNDPDEAKRRKLGKPSQAFDSEGRPLSPDELRSVGIKDTPTEVDRARAELDALNASGRPLSPDIMRKQKFRGLAQREELVPGQEPPRRSLTEPPPGFRSPVASAPVEETELPSEVAAKARRRWLDFSD